MSNSYHSYVGNQKYVNAYATPINIYFSSLSIADLRKNSKYLPTNALIISSPQKEDEEDIDITYDAGTPAIVVTDGIGNVLPLTYTLALSNIKYDENENIITSEPTYTRQEIVSIVNDRITYYIDDRITYYIDKTIINK